MPSSSASVATTPSSSPQTRSALDRAALLGGVARPVGREPRGGSSSPPASSVSRAMPEDELGGLAALEADGALPARTTSAASRAAASASVERPLAGPRVEQRRLARRVCARGRAARRRRDDVDVEAGQAQGELGGVGDGGRGPAGTGVDAVERADAAQAPQDERDVGAEDPAVDVRLVDHHVREVARDVGQRAWFGQHPDVQHVRVGQDGLARAADARAPLRGVSPSYSAGRSAGAQAEPARLVLGEGLRRVEVERARARLARAAPRSTGRL